MRRLADEVRAGVNEAMRSLRADLASAARDAKRSKRPVDYQYDARQTANAAAREAEAILNEFRQQLRTDLRSQAARGGLPESVIPQLRLELARVRASILETISRT